MQAVAARVQSTWGGAGSEDPACSSVGLSLWVGVSPAAVVVSTHEHFTPPTADGAIRLVPIVIILVSTLQEAVLGRM